MDDVTFARNGNALRGQSERLLAVSQLRVRPGRSLMSMNACCEFVVGHLSVASAVYCLKSILSKMTYYVSSGTLSSTHSFTMPQCNGTVPRAAYWHSQESPCNLSAPAPPLEAYTCISHLTHLLPHWLIQPSLTSSLRWDLSCRIQCQKRKRVVLSPIFRGGTPKFWTCIFKYCSLPKVWECLVEPKQKKIEKRKKEITGVK